MRYLVTGGLGFIGSEVCRQLLAMPGTTKVSIIDDNSKGYGVRNVADLMNDPRFCWVEFDLTDQFIYRDYIYDMVAYADIIINCAAKIGGIGYFNKIPAQILRNNNLIVSNVLDAMVDVKCNHRIAQRFVYMSSSMVFENAEKFPSAETDLASTVIPKSAYGFSKLSGEFYCTAFAQEYGLEYTIVRPFNAVGPEKPDPNFVGYSHVLPDFVCKIKNGQGTPDVPLSILGDGSQVRHYTDVREIAKGIIMAARSEEARNNDFNIAIGIGHSVLDVATLVWKTMKPDAPILYTMTADPFPCDVQYRSPCIEKARDVLGYEAKITLEDNIEEVVQSVLDLING